MKTPPEQKVWQLFFLPNGILLIRIIYCMGLDCVVITLQRCIGLDCINYTLIEFNTVKLEIFSNYLIVITLKDTVNPTSYTALCPFTQISAEGISIDEAAAKWRIEAKKRLSEYKNSFRIPKYFFTFRKVWVGK
jgi:hypothetical protein